MAVPVGMCRFVAKLLKSASDPRIITTQVIRAQKEPEVAGSLHRVLLNSRVHLNARVSEMKSTQKIVVFGTGGNCIDVAETILDLAAAKPDLGFEFLGFLDDNSHLWGKDIHGFPVLGPLTDASKIEGAQFVAAIGSPHNFWRKSSILDRVGLPPERYATIIHPSAYVSRSATLGPGTVILQNVTIASNVRIGSHVMVLPQSVLSHDDVVGDESFITGGVSISGGVKIGKACYIGTGSCIKGNVSIDDHVLIGMGSVVLGDLAGGAIYVGNPARKLRTLDISS